MKSDHEIHTLQGLANLAATLVNTNHHKAREAAEPVLVMIKSQFQSAGEQAEERIVSANVGEPERVTLREYQLPYDPIGAAIERLRLATLARDEAVEAANRAEIESTELQVKADEARRAAAKAQSDLVSAVEAFNRA